MRIEDKLTDAEFIALTNARQTDARVMRPTQAQVRDLAVAQEAVHAAVRGLSSHDACRVVEAALDALPLMSPTDLEHLGNKLCRMAWEIDRGYT